MPLLDIAILAGGYLLRLLYGGYLAGTGVSDWMFLTVISAAFFLSFGKRRNEMLLYGKSNRKSLEKYTLTFLDNSMQMFMTLTIVFYSLSCSDKSTFISSMGVNILWSVPVVMIICIRYNMLVSNNCCEGDPVEVIFSDKLLLVLILGFCISLGACIYIPIKFL